VRKIAVAIAILFLSAFVSISAHGAPEPDERWIPPSPTANGQIGISFDDREDYFYIGALRALVVKNGTYTGPVCTSLVDANCANAEYFAIKAVLAPCMSPAQVNCVEGISARKSDGTEEKAEFVDYVSSDKSLYWTGDEAKNVPDSKVESIWHFPSITHSGGRDFLLNAILDGSYRKTGDPNWGRMVAMIQPVTKIPDSQTERPRAFTNDTLDFVTPEQVAIAGGWTGAQRGGLTKNCAATIDGACFRREAFPVNTSFTLSIRTNSQVTGWIHGRMTNPSLSIAQRDRFWVTTVSGEPTEVPVVARWFNKEEFGNDLRNAYAGAAYGSFGIGSSGVAQRYGSTGQYDATTLNRFNVVRSYVNDKASANPRIWSFGSIEPKKLASDAAALGGRGYCVTNAKGLAGMVMTNATVYDGSIPAYSEKDQALNYLVSAPHYTASGSEFLGTYDLVIRADIAKCIYGFSKTPTSATVSIVKGDSVEKVSTTTLVEKDGWLALSANGFTYSSPKISVKLNQAPEEAPAKVISAAPTNPVLKKPASKTISCLRGSSKKIVKGVNPKCPKGYKLVK
jgi:hypothetical protein